MRAEFPGAFLALAPLRRLGVAQEPPGWAFLSALGAGFIASAVVELLVVVVYPILFPPFREQLILIPARTLWQCAGAIAGGAVATRAGGARALLLYVGFELARLAALLPGSVYSCARDPSAAGGRIACDYPALVAHDWPICLAIALGVLGSRVLAAHGVGANYVLRAAGALSASMTIAFSAGGVALFLVVLPNQPSGLILGFMGLGDIATYSLAAGTLVGGAPAGALLAHQRIAAPLVLALCVVAPSWANGIAFLRMQSGPVPSLPFQVWVMTFSWLWSPALGALALFIAWVVVRRLARTRA